LLERSAGFLYVEQCVLAHVREALKLGAVVRAQEPVLSWQAGADHVQVETPAGHYTAAKLVITAGPWAARLLEAHGRRLTVMRQVALWFGTHDDRLFQRGTFPTFVLDSPAGFFYGFPVIDSADGLKAAQHYGAPELGGPDQIDRSVHPEDEDK